jgi:hypothetical protein
VGSGSEGGNFDATGETSTGHNVDVLQSRGGKGADAGGEWQQRIHAAATTHTAGEHTAAAVMGPKQPHRRSVVRSEGVVTERGGCGCGRKEEGKGSPLHGVKTLATRSSAARENAQLSRALSG